MKEIEIYLEHKLKWIKLRNKEIATHYAFSQLSAYSGI